MPGMPLPRRRDWVNSVVNLYGFTARTLRPVIDLPPGRITLINTSKCNLRCRYCRVRSGLNRQRDNELTGPEWDTVLSGIPRTTIVAMTGGEPFADPNIDPILDCLLGRRVPVSIVSNGTLLDEQRIEHLVGHGLPYLMLSLQGTAAYHDRAQGVPGTFDTVLAAIDSIRRTKERLNAKRPVLCVKSIVFPDNTEELRKLVDLMEENGAIEHMSFSFEVGRSLQHSYRVVSDTGEWDAAVSLFEYPPDARNRVMEFVRWVCRAARSSRLQLGFDLRPARAGDLVDYVRDPRHFEVPRCRVPWNEFSLYYDGQISSCISHDLGNIRELDYDVRKVLRSAKYRAFLKQLRKNQPHVAPCMSCNVAPVRRKMRSIGSRRPPAQ